MGCPDPHRAMAGLSRGRTEIRVAEPEIHVAEIGWGPGRKAAPSPGECPQGHGQQHEGPSLSGEMGWSVPPASLAVATSSCHLGPLGLGSVCATGHHP